jgi:hypothetical protein
MKNTKFIEPGHVNQCNRLRSGLHSLSVAVRWNAAALVIMLTACEPGTVPTVPVDYVSLDAVPVHFTNLQVLPETIARDDLIDYMRMVSRSLGVRCTHCHVTKTEDYATDDVEAKRIARDMMRLVRDFNELTPERADSTAVTCEMCHRGSRKPPVQNDPTPTSP